MANVQMCDTGVYKAAWSIQVSWDVKKKKKKAVYMYQKSISVPSISKVVLRQKKYFGCSH